jgi:hypothetical protein
VLCWVGVHCGIFNVSNISYLYRPPLSSDLPIPGLVSLGIIFAFTHMCTQYLHHIHPPTPFPIIFSLLLVPPPYTTTGSVLPSYFQFCRRKKTKLTFCLFKIKIATQGVFLWHFHGVYDIPYWGIYVLYPNRLISFIFLPSTLVPGKQWSEIEKMASSGP